jgi:hypothetical protein
MNQAAILKSGLLLAVANLVSCGGGSDDITPVPLARPVNYEQCNPVAPHLTQSDAILQSAGVQILARGCASDGAIFVAACDTTAYLLRSVEVPKFQESIARGLGYKAPTEFSTFEAFPCPAQ